MLHSVTMHEIVFQFTCVWPLSIALSLLIRPHTRHRPWRIWLGMIGAGPVFAIYALSLLMPSVTRPSTDEDADEPESQRVAWDQRLARIQWWLWLPWLVVGLAFQSLPAAAWRNVLHYVLIGLTAVIWLVFFLQLFRRVSERTSAWIAVLNLVMSGVLVLTVIPIGIVFEIASLAVIASMTLVFQDRTITKVVNDFEGGGRTTLTVLLRWLLTSGLTLCGIGGLIILWHPGFTPGYFRILHTHVTIGYITALVFVAYTYAHLAKRFGHVVASQGLALSALLTFTVVTTNWIFSTRGLANIPVYIAIYVLSRSIWRSARVRPDAAELKSGLALLGVLTFTFATGAYIAEPFNSKLNNNMGLYVLYMHGTGVLLLLPWLGGLFFAHGRTVLPMSSLNRFRRALAVGIPVFLIGFAAASVFIHWKWYGIDAGQHFWPPAWVEALWEPKRETRVTYVTQSGPPPVTAMGTYPLEFDDRFRDWTVCGQMGCHEGLVQEWKASPHRFAGSNLFFRKVIERMEIEMGSNQFNYFCINCHDPALVLSSDRTRGIPASALENSPGITCKACHLMTYGSKTGHPEDGRYEIREENSYGINIGDPDYLTRWRDNIRADLRLHFRNYSIPKLAHHGEVCSACHVASMPEFITGLDYNMKVTDLYESWLESPYPARGETCVTCHMPQRSTDEREFNYPDHRIPGLNLAAEAMVGSDPSDQADARNLDKFVADLVSGKKGEWPDTLPFLDMAIDLPEEPSGPNEVVFRVKTTNSRVGHYFHAGPSSLNEVWLEVWALDRDGNEIMHSGGLDEHDRSIGPEAHRLGAKILAKDGTVIRDCAIWRVAGVEGSRRIKPLETIEDRYNISIPEGYRGGITVHARWNHRRASQAFVDWVYGGKGPPFPVVVIAQATQSFKYPFDPKRQELRLENYGVK